MRFSRRAVIAGGGAATLLPNVSFSAPDGPQLDWIFDREDQRWGLVIRYLGDSWHVRLSEFGAEASFVRVSASERSISIAMGGCRFPGRAARPYEVRFDLGRIGPEWRLRMAPGDWLPGWASKSTHVALKAFMHGDDAAAFALSRPRADALCRSLFGRRVEVRSGIEVLFRAAGGWCLHSSDGGIVGLKDAANIKSLTLRLVRAADGDGALLQARGGDTTSDALVAVATLHRPAGSIPFGGGEAAVELRPREPQEVSVAFRQWGDEEATAAFMRSAFDVRVVDQGGPTSVFSLSDALFVRRDVATASTRRRASPAHERDERVLDRLDGVVAPKDVSVETRYGPFAVKGDDLRASDAKPKASADFAGPLPASGTRATIEWADGAFTAFEVRALLTLYALALPDREPGTRTASVQHPAPSLWSRMDFSGTEVAFVLATDAAGRPSARNARGVIAIGKGREPRPWPEAALAEGEAPVELALDGCRLKVRRPGDLLALDFRFRGLNLQIGEGGARIAPARRGAVGGAGQGPQGDDGPGSSFDDRALLVVEFPPQHVAERAYLRQVNDGQPLPELPLGPADPAGRLDQIAIAVRAGGLATRKKARLDARAKLIAERGAGAPDVVAFLAVQQLLSKGGDVDAPDAWPDAVEPGPTRDALLARWRALPIDQRVYLGTDPAVADFDARAVIGAIWRSYRAAAMRATGASISELAGALPDVTLDPATERSILLRLSAGSAGDPALSPDNPNASEMPAAIAAIEAAKEARDHDYAVARDAWKASLPVSGLGAAPAFAQYRGRARLLAWFDAGDAATRALLLGLVQATAKRLADDASADEAFPTVTEARLSGPSRLAFRVDGSFTSLVDPDRPGPSWLPFSLLGLTRWGGFDLAVIRRAERYYKDPGGRLPVPSLRLAGGDSAEILANQGIRPGRAIDGRLQDVRTAASTSPGEFDTAIELPTRLTLSSSQEGRFRTPQPVPDGFFDPPGPSRISAPLWTAALEPRIGSPDVRAVASSDFLPSAFDPNGAEPVRGPWAPWSREAHVADPGLPPDRFRMALDAYDRHEIVGLTSVYGLPVLGRYDANGQITDGSQFTPPPGYRLKGLSDLPGFGDQSAIYRPQPLGVSELRLSALGGSLNVLTDFVPPAAALDKGGKPLFPALTIERWRQRTVLGRDIEVQVVYKGYLYPLGFKASLVKLTERRFAQNAANGRYTAFLIQRLFIRVGERDKAFPALGQADLSRRFPAKTLTMVTAQTPDIVDPNGETPTLGAASVDERPSGALVVPPSQGRTRNPGLAFWPRSSPGPGGNIGFTFLIEGKADAATMPLVFIDNAAANDVDTLEKLADYYNASAAAGLRTVQLGGTQRRYAEERKAGEASNETFSWEIHVEGRKGFRVGQAPAPLPDPSQNESYVSDALLQGADQPPFYPYVAAADIRVGAAERFVGRPLPRQLVAFHQPYVLNGFTDTGEKDLSGEVYLRLRNGPLKLDMGQAGDQGGGLGRVAQDVYWLSRANGPVGWSPASMAAGPAPAAPDVPPPSLSSFFNGDAKLLGIISFSDILAAASVGFPQMTEAVESATEDTAELLRQTVIPSIVAALDALYAAWQAAGAALKQQTGVAGPGSGLDIDKVYPDIGPSLRELGKALDDVAAAHGDDVIAPLNRVQESARRFASAIERTAQDPIAPLREEVRARFRAFSQGIEQYTSLLSEQLLDTLAALQKNARARLKAALIRAVAALPEPALDLLLALPLPPGVPPPDDSLAADLRSAAAAGLTAFVTALPDTGPIGDADIETGLERARAAAQAALQAAADARLDPYVRELDAAKAEVFRLEGLAFGRLFGPDGWIIKLQQAEEDLTAAVRDAGRDLLQRIGPPIRAVLQNLLELEAARRLAKSYASICDEGVKQVAAFVAQALPQPNDLAGLQSAVVAYGAASGLLAADAAALGDRVAALATRYRTARDRIAGDADLSALCQGVADFPGPALAQLLASRQAILREIDALLARSITVAAPDDARAPLSALLDQVAALLGKGPVFDAGGGPLKDLDDLLAKAAAAQPNGLLGDIVRERVATLRAKGIQALGVPAKALGEAVDAARRDLADATVRVQAVRTSLESAIASHALAELIPAEQALASLASSLAAGRAAIADVVEASLADAVRASFKPVAEVHGKIREARHEAYVQLRSVAPDDASVGLLALLVQKVMGGTTNHLADLLLIDPKTDGDDSSDALSDEDALMQTAASGSDDAALEAAATLANTWSKSSPAVVRLGQRIGDILTAALRGDLAQFVDLQPVRAQVEAAVRQMLPARIRRSYTFAMDLGDALKELIAFQGDQPQLQLTATGVIDLTKPTASTFSARGTLPGFTLHLLPDFEVVHLIFAESAFTSESGKPFSLSLRVADVVLGEKVQFLKDLQNYLAAPKDGSGFFLVLMTGRGRPGIAAGYKLALSPISLGDLYISNISLNVAAELPFDDGDARFVISIGRPEAPLVISAFPYAGAGYFGLIANPKGIIGFEASFEFGGGGGFSFGPLKGEGRITVGIFVRQVSGYTDLYGIFFAGGSARIACFSLSTSLLVRMSQSGSDLVGQAVFTFSFSIGITDFHFAVTVSKRQAGSRSDGGNSVENQMGGRTRMAALSLDDSGGFACASEPVRVATLSSVAQCKGENWAEHRRYFDPGFHATLL